MVDQELRAIMERLGQRIQAQEAPTRPPPAPARVGGRGGPGMLSAQLQQHIANACVTISTPEGPGRGVLIPGAFILTAAHCVEYLLDGRMMLGDDVIQDLVTSTTRLHVGPWAVELVADIALLGALDPHRFPREWEAFTAWCAATAPVPLCVQEFPLFDPVPVSLYTHTGHWLQGTAQQGAPHASVLAVTVDGPIPGGTSGSPVVTAQGEIVGIVSHSFAPDEEAAGESLAPRPHLTLPGWALHQIQAAQQ